MRGGLTQRWADKPVTEVDGHDIQSVVAETRKRGAPGLKRRSKNPTETRAYAMHSCLSGMFRWLLQHRRVERNPCVDVHRPDMAKARERKLSEQEMDRLLASHRRHRPAVRPGDAIAAADRLQIE